MKRFWKRLVAWTAWVDAIFLATGLSVGFLLGFVAASYSSGVELDSGVATLVGSAVGAFATVVGAAALATRQGQRDTRQFQGLITEIVGELRDAGEVASEVTHDLDSLRDEKDVSPDHKEQMEARVYAAVKNIEGLATVAGELGRDRALGSIAFRKELFKLDAAIREVRRYFDRHELRLAMEGRKGLRSLWSATAEVQVTAQGFLSSQDVDYGHLDGKSLKRAKLNLDFDNGYGISLEDHEAYFKEQ